MEKKQNIYNMIMLVFITMILTLLVSTILMYNYVNSHGGNIQYIAVTKDTTELSKQIQGIRSVIDKYYIGNDIDEQTLIDYAIKGYVIGLDDEYSEYMTESEWNEYRENALGNYIGIGVYLIGQEDGMRITGVIKDSAADKNGLQVDDLITQVDDNEANINTLDDVINYIKNTNEGSEINFKVIRNGEELNLKIKTELVRIVQVSTKMLENNIGYMQFLTFDEAIAKDFKEKYEELKSKGAKSFIIDIRNNGGGVFDETLSILDYMLPKDVDVLVTYDKDNGEEIYKTEEPQTMTEPIVLLVNDKSASASEILAGALKDNKRATIVGIKTYGKGTMQDVFRLQNGSALKITTNEFYTPLKNKINKVGIEPDVTVELPEEYSDKYKIPEEFDTQLQEAIKILSEQ